MIKINVTGRHMQVSDDLRSTELDVEEASLILGVMISQGAGAEVPRSGPESDFREEPVP